VAGQSTASLLPEFGGTSEMNGLTARESVQRSVPERMDAADELVEDLARELARRTAAPGAGASSSA
jgi:hypothetical protein